MSGKQPVEVLLRPAVELYTVAACAGAAFLSLVAPWSLALSPAMGVGSALAFGAYGAIRYRDARVILRYRRNIRRLLFPQEPAPDEKPLLADGHVLARHHVARQAADVAPVAQDHAGIALAGPWWPHGRSR